MKDMVAQNAVFKIWQIETESIIAHCCFRYAKNFFCQR